MTSYECFRVIWVVILVMLFGYAFGVSLLDDSKISDLLWLLIILFLIGGVVLYVLGLLQVF